MKENQAKRAFDAVIRYERAAAMVTRLTRRISDALNRCEITGLAMESENPGVDTMSLWDGRRVKNHLWHAYNDATLDESGYGMRHLDEEEQESLLTDESSEQFCRHCYEAWVLIRERKEARAEFGRAKLAIRAIGRAALKVAA